MLGIPCCHCLNRLNQPLTHTSSAGTRCTCRCGLVMTLAVCCWNVRCQDPAQLLPPKPRAQVLAQVSGWLSAVNFLNLAWPYLLVHALVQATNNDHPANWSAQVANSLTDTMYEEAPISRVSDCSVLGAFGSVHSFRTSTSLWEAAG